MLLICFFSTAAKFREGVLMEEELIDYGSFPAAEVSVAMIEIRMTRIEVRMTTILVTVTTIEVRIEDDERSK